MKRNIKGCKFCKGDLTENLVRDKISRKLPHIQIIGDYKNQTTKVKLYCSKHNIEWETTPQRLLKSNGCQKCGLEKLSKQSFITRSEYINKLSIANPNLELLSEYNGMEKDVTVRCKKCGHSFTTNAHSLIANGTSCRKCSFTYKGEDRIIEILNNMNIDYVHQYRFLDCKDKRPLPFDFYLPKFNTCIEFDGQQHFEPKFGDKSFQDTIKHDKIKDEYCKKNNINLIRIPYYNSNNIERIIKDNIMI